jgi:hypothetical protein
MDLSALKTITVTVTNADADVGTAIPQNMRRCIYKIKATNLFAGPNLLTLGKRENWVAAATVVVDLIQAVLIYDIWNDPDELKEDSAPLYIVEGAIDDPTSLAWGVTTGPSHVRAVCSAAGQFFMTLWYTDTPAP